MALSARLASPPQNKSKGGCTLETHSKGWTLPFRSPPFPQHYRFVGMHLTNWPIFYSFNPKLTFELIKGCTRPLLFQWKPHTSEKNRIQSEELHNHQPRCKMTSCDGLPAFITHTTYQEGVCLFRPIPIHLTKSSHVHIVVIAVVHWCLRAETHPCGNVVSAVIMFCLRLGRHGSINWTAWSSRDMCVNWNEP